MGDSYATYCACVGALAFVVFVWAVFAGAPLWAVLAMFSTSAFCFNAGFE